MKIDFCYDNKKGSLMEDKNKDEDKKLGEDKKVLAGYTMGFALVFLKNENTNDDDNDDE